MFCKRFAWFLAWALILCACQPAAATVAPSPTPAATASPAASSTPEAPPVPETGSPVQPTLLPDLAEALPFEAPLPAGFAVRIFKLNQPVLAEEVGYEQVWAALKEQSHWAQTGEQGLRAGQELVSIGDRLETPRLRLGGDELYAVMETSAGSLDVTIRVYRTQQSIFEMPAENIFVRPPLYGLWTYGEHWALETLDSIVIDGQSVNAGFGYQKSYEFSLLDGKPVYLFEKSSQVGLNLDGQEVLLPGQTVTHYECCSGTLLNPRQGEKLLVFLMSQGQEWYYVELEKT